MVKHFDSILMGNVLEVIKKDPESRENDLKAVSQKIHSFYFYFYFFFYIWSNRAMLCLHDCLMLFCSLSRNSRCFMIKHNELKQGFSERMFQTSARSNSKISSA